jgi:hypothetical protein
MKCRFHFRTSGEQKKNRFLQLKPIEKTILTVILVLIGMTKTKFSEVSIR